MPDRIAAAIAAALALVPLAACSSRPPSQIASTASVAIDGNNRNFHIVKCGQFEWTRTIEIGGDFSGAKVSIDESAQQPLTQSVHIRNLGGFSGMYSRGGDGDADTSISGGKYTISGTANGYKTDKPGEPASATFKIVVTC